MFVGEIVTELVTCTVLDMPGWRQVPRVHPIWGQDWGHLWLWPHRWPWHLFLRGNVQYQWGGPLTPLTVLWLLHLRTLLWRRTSCSVGWDPPGRLQGHPPGRLQRGPSYLSGAQAFGWVKPPLIIFTIYYSCSIPFKRFNITINFWFQMRNDVS